MRQIFAGFGAVVVIGLTAATATGAEDSRALISIGDSEYAFTLRSEQSDWVGSTSFGSVSIRLIPNEEGREAGWTGLSLGFEISGDQARNGEARLTRRVDSGFQNLFCEDDSEGGALVVELESVAMENETLSIDGRMACQLGTSENFGQDIDLSDPLEISGSFVLALPKL